jgi:hypothetical protein
MTGSQGPGLVERADARFLEHLVGCEDELVGLERDGIADAVGSAAPDETPLCVMFHEPGSGSFHCA